MLPYDMPLYRPPSEGNNLIVQATYGCSFNRCAFCSMYRSKEFYARPLDEVFKHIEVLTRHWPDAERVFLADGDAMSLPSDNLVAIADKLAYELPNLKRISAYATPGNLLRKSEDELRRLKARGLSLIYVGVESGSAEVLKRISKGASPNGIVAAINKAIDCGLDVSATVILGLGGKALSEEHIRGTADVINRAPPTYLSTLQLALEEDVFEDYLKRWETPFEFQDDWGVLDEMRRLLAALAPARNITFRSNHASNCLPLAGVLPEDTPKLLAQVEGALGGARALRPDWLRGF